MRISGWILLPHPLQGLSFIKKISVAARNLWIACFCPFYLDVKRTCTKYVYPWIITDAPLAGFVLHFGIAQNEAKG